MADYDFTHISGGRRTIIVPSVRTHRMSGGRQQVLKDTDTYLKDMLLGEHCAHVAIGVVKSQFCVFNLFFPRV